MILIVIEETGGTNCSCFSLKQMLNIESTDVIIYVNYSEEVTIDANNYYVTIYNYYEQLFN